MSKKKDSSASSRAIRAKADLANYTEKAPKGESVNVSAFAPRASLPRVEGVIVRSMSPMIKPKFWPKHEGRNMVLVGVLTKCFKSGEWKDNENNIRIGTGVEVVPVGQPVGVSLPVTATLRTGLEITGDGTSAVSPYFGRVV